MTINSHSPQRLLDHYDRAQPWPAPFEPVAPRERWTAYFATPLSELQINFT